MNGIKNISNTNNSQFNISGCSNGSNYLTERDKKFFEVKLTKDEKIFCLKEIASKLKKILYVYEKTQEPNSNYNYKVYCGGILLYVSSSNELLEGELINVVINLNSIISNDFEKNQIRRIVFESINIVEFILKKYMDSLDDKSIKNEGDETNKNTNIKE